jgi:hypothetical protein
MFLEELTGLLLACSFVSVVGRFDMLYFELSPMTCAESSRKLSASTVGMIWPGSSDVLNYARGSQC